jgi:hypothetical protein
MLRVRESDKLVLRLQRRINPRRRSLHQNLLMSYEKTDEELDEAIQEELDR